MKNKMFFLLMGLIMMISALGVNAADSLISCTADIPGVINVGTELNASFNVTDQQGAGQNTGNFSSVSVLFEARSTLTANSSFAFLANATNTSAQNYTNFTMPAANLIIIEPADNYDIRATCYGITVGSSDAGDNVTVATTVTGVTIDLGDVPAIPTTSHATDTVFDDVTTKTVTYAVAGPNTTSCRIAFLSDGDAPRFSGTNTFAMTHSGDTCTYTVSKAAVPDGTYSTYVQATDETNSSISSKVNLRIKTLEGGAIDPISEIGVNLDKVIPDNRKNLQIAVVLILFVVIGWAMFFKKK